jgi:hypothetical protein
MFPTERRDNFILRLSLWQNSHLSRNRSHAAPYTFYVKFEHFEAATRFCLCSGPSSGWQFLY